MQCDVWFGLGAAFHCIPSRISHQVLVWSSSLLNSSPVSLRPIWFIDRSLIRGLHWSYSSKALWLLIKCHLVWSMMGEGPHRFHSSQRCPRDSNKHGCTLLSLVLPLPKHVQPCPLGWVWTHPFLGSCWLHFQGSVRKLKGYLKSPSFIRTGEEHWPVFSFLLSLLARDQQFLRGLLSLWPELNNDKAWNQNYRESSMLNSHQLSSVRGNLWLSSFVVFIRTCVSNWLYLFGCWRMKGREEKKKDLFGKKRITT